MASLHCQLTPHTSGPQRQLVVSHQKQTAHFQMEQQKQRPREAELCSGHSSQIKARASTCQLGPVWPIQCSIDTGRPGLTAKLPCIAVTAPGM